MGIMVPFAVSDGLIAFGDLRGAVSGDGEFTASAGVGARAAVADGWLLGGYAYFDMGSGLYGSNFKQVSGGIELLSDSWEFRLNGYLPVGDTEAEVDGLTTVTVEGGSLAVRQGYEVALHGVDAEVGFTLPVLAPEDGQTLKLFANAFSFDSARTETLNGFGARLEYSFAAFESFLPGSALTLGAGLRYDNRDDLSGGIFARLSAPLGGDKTIARVERRDAITTDAGALGERQNALFADGRATGTVANISLATSNLNGTITGAGLHGIILASGEINVDTALQLAAGQVLLGGGGVLELRAADSGKTVHFTNTGAATTLKGSSTGLPESRADVVILAEAATVQSLAISGGRNAIVGQGTDDVTIRDVAISGGLNGIKLANLDGALIEGVEIADIVCTSNCVYSQSSDPDYVKQAGINAVGVKNLTIRDVTMDNVSHGVFAASVIDESGWPPVMTDQVENLVIENLSITETVGEGLLLVGADGVSARNVSIVNVGAGWDLDMVVLIDSVNVAVDGARLSGGVNGINVLHGLKFDAADLGPMNTTFSNIEIDNMSRAGIVLNWVDGITFNDVSIHDVGLSGISMSGDSFFGAVRNVTFNDVSISGVAPYTGGWETHAGLNLMGPMENISGDISYTGTEPACAAMSPGMYTTLTQAPGKLFSVNGTTIDNTSMATDCQ